LPTSHRPQSNAPPALLSNKYLATDLRHFARRPTATWSRPRLCKSRVTPPHPDRMPNFQQIARVRHNLAVSALACALLRHQRQTSSRSAPSAFQFFLSACPLCCRGKNPARPKIVVEIGDAVRYSVRMNKYRAPRSLEQRWPANAYRIAPRARLKQQARNTKTATKRHKKSRRA
jgi:hypothetical protein